jgi:hypothetical protein
MHIPPLTLKNVLVRVLLEGVKDVERCELCDAEVLYYHSRSTKDSLE